MIASRPLDFVTQRIRQDAVLNATHQLVGLFSQTEGQDLNFQLASNLPDIGKFHIQCGVGFGQGGQRSPCRWQEHPQYGWS